MINYIISAIFLSTGCLTLIISLFGVMKFKFVMNRMHSVAIIDSIGFFLIITGLIFYVFDIGFIPKLLLVLVFQWVGSPIASHMVARLELETDEHIEEHMKKEEE